MFWSRTYKLIHDMIVYCNCSTQFRFSFSTFLRVQVNFKPLFFLFLNLFSLFVVGLLSLILIAPGRGNYLHNWAIENIIILTRFKLFFSVKIHLNSSVFYVCYVFISELMDQYLYNFHIYMQMCTSFSGFIIQTLYCQIHSSLILPYLKTNISKSFSCYYLFSWILPVLAAFLSLCAHTISGGVFFFFFFFPSDKSLNGSLLVLLGCLFLTHNHATCPGFIENIPSDSWAVFHLWARTAYILCGWYFLACLNTPRPVFWNVLTI